MHFYSSFLELQPETLKTEKLVGLQRDHPLPDKRSKSAKGLPKDTQKKIKMEDLQSAVSLGQGNVFLLIVSRITVRNSENWETSRTSM